MRARACLRGRARARARGRVYTRLHLPVQATARRSFIKPRPFGTASQATPQGRAEPEPHSAPRRWSGVLDLQVAGAVVWLRRLSAPARPPGRAGTPSRSPVERAAIDNAVEVLKQLGPVSICAQTYTLLNSAARAMAEITCTGITSTQPVGGDTGVLPC